MSDYTQITDFSVKDGLTTGDSEKIILGADFDGEFSALSTAISTKYDSGDISSEAQAEALTLDTVLITPLQLGNVLQDNGGMAYDIQQLADPNADQLLGWDDSAGAVVGFTCGDGLEFSGATIRLEHLGIGDLEDPAADRIMFWDDSAGNMAWLSLGSDLAITGTSLGVVDANLTITESQISDLGTYLSAGDTAATLTVTTLTNTTLTSTTINVGSTASSLTQNGTNTDQIDVEGDTIFSHESGTYNSAKIHFSTSTPTGGNDGDIWYEYTA